MNGAGGGSHKGGAGGSGGGAGPSNPNPTGAPGSASTGAGAANNTNNSRQIRQYGSNMTSTLDVEHLRRKLKVPVGSSAQESTHPVSSNRLSVPVLPRRAASLSPSISPLGSPPRNPKLGTDRKTSLPDMKVEKTQETTVEQALELIKEMTHRNSPLPMLMSPPPMLAENQLESAQLLVATYQPRHTEKRHNDNEFGALSKKRKSHSDRAASASPPRRMDQNSEHKAKKRKIEIPDSTLSKEDKGNQGTLAENTERKPKRSSRASLSPPRSSYYEESDAKRRAVHNDTKDAYKYTDTRKVVKEEIGRARPSASRGRDPTKTNDRTPAMSTKLQEEARKLKHLADAEFKTNPLEGLDYYLTSGLKFLESAKEMEAECEANDPQKNPAALYKATAQFLDNCAQMCLTQREAARAVLFYRCMSVSLARAHYLQRDRLKRAKEEVVAQLNKQPSPPAHQHAGGSKNVNSPTFKSVSSPISGGVAAPASSHSHSAQNQHILFLTEQVDDILKIFDAWQKADTHNHGKLVDLPFPHPLDKYITSPTLLTPGVIAYVRQAMNHLTGTTSS